MSTLAELPELVGFFSYSREDDEAFRGGLSTLREGIYRELSAQLGRSKMSFRLWQDQAAIAPGKLWESEIKAAVDQALFFIPIVTPRAVKSNYCQFELEAFLAREKELGRSDLVFPILYISVSELANETKWRNDPVLSIIARRQYADWRALRHVDVQTTAVREQIERLCGKIVETLNEPWVSPEERRREAEAKARQQAEEESRRLQAEAKRHAEEEEGRKQAEAAAKRRVEEEEARKQAEAEAPQRARDERSRQEAEAKRRVALLVGNSTFASDSGIANLRFPPADVEAFAAVLEDRKIGRFDRVVRLVESDHDEILTQFTILLKEWPGATTLFYYSGHGKVSDNGRLILAASDTTEKLLPATGVPFENLIATKEDVGVGRFFVILDCCYAGLASPHIKGSEDDQLKAFAEGKGVFFLGAANATTVAREDTRLGHGVLTAAILEGLRSGQADTDGDGRITGPNLFAWCRDYAIKRDTKRPVQVNRVVDDDLVLAFSDWYPSGNQSSHLHRAGAPAEAIPPEDSRATALRRVFARSFGAELNRYLAKGEIADVWLGTIGFRVVTVKHVRGFRVDDAVRNSDRKEHFKSLLKTQLHKLRLLNRRHYLRIYDLKLIPFDLPLDVVRELRGELVHFKDDWIVVSDYSPGMSLSDLVSEWVKTGSVRAISDETISIAKQLAASLCEGESYNLQLIRLTPEDIYIEFDERGRHPLVRFAPLSITQLVEHVTAAAKWTDNSSPYTAPELWERKLRLFATTDADELSVKIDRANQFALGMIIWFMLNGKLDFKSDDDDAANATINRFGRWVRDDLPEAINNDPIFSVKRRALCRIVKRLVRFNPAERWDSMERVNLLLSAFTVDSDQADLLSVVKRIYTEVCGSPDGRLNDRFYKEFYHRLFSGSKKLEKLFANIDMERQRRILHEALGQLLNFRQPHGGDPTSLTRFVLPHKHLGLSREDYRAFGKALVDTFDDGMQQLHSKGDREFHLAALELVIWPGIYYFIEKNCEPRPGR
jgi:serine/threonine protein kinase